MDINKINNSNYFKGALTVKTSSIKKDCSPIFTKAQISQDESIKGLSIEKRKKHNKTDYSEIFTKEPFKDYYTEDKSAKVIYDYDEIPQGSHKNVKDARGCDLTKTFLTRPDIIDMKIDKTTVLSERQAKILKVPMETAKDPGLGVRTLHAKGITGKEVKIAIIDEPLSPHKEYANRVINYEETGFAKTPEKGSMQASSVVSVAAGQTVGTAPEAEIVYIASENSNKNYADAINRILDLNQRLPQEEKIPVISLSHSFDREMPDYDLVQQAVSRAKDEDVFVISPSIRLFYNIDLNGANRDLLKDVNDVQSYSAGANWENSTGRIPLGKRLNTLLVPMDHRTVADYKDGTSYRYEGNDGGISLTSPYLAGIYALAVQINPNITPELFITEAMRTADACRNPNGILAGRMLNPQKLIDAIKPNPQN